MVGNSEADLPQQHQGSTFRTTPPVRTTWESWGKEAICLLCIFCFVLTAFWLPSTHASCLSREMGMDPAALSCLLRLPQQLQVVCACWVSTSLAASGCQLLKEVNGQLVVYVFFFFFSFISSAWRRQNQLLVADSMEVLLFLTHCLHISIYSAFHYAAVYQTSLLEAFLKKFQ